MSASIQCTACRFPMPVSAIRCAACGAQIASGESRPHNKRLMTLATWPGLGSLVAAQEKAGSYWFLARSDFRRLSALVESWPAPDDPVRRLLAAKLDRGIICDPDQLPREVVAIGSRVEFRIGSDLETCVVADPAAMEDLQDPVPLASPLGAVLLGMIEGRSMRAHGPDGLPYTLSVETVGTMQQAGIPASPAAGSRTAAAAARA